MAISSQLARVKKMEAAAEAKDNVLKMPCVLNVDLDEWERQSIAYHNSKQIGFYADAERWNHGG